MVAVGYAKLGRSITLDPNDAGFQGDAEAPNLLYRLARRSPDVKWVIVGRNRGEVQLPPNVVNLWAGAQERAAQMPPIPSQGYNMPWPVNWTNAPAWWCSEQSAFEDALEATIASFDGMVVHLGQHGTTNISIPESHEPWDVALADPSKMTNPQDWSKAYARFLIRGLNALGDRTNGQAPVVWICTDPRNYVKCRDLKWHTGLDDILAQYDWERQQRHERFRDPRHPFDFQLPMGQVKTDRQGEIWVVKHTYRLAGLELMILPDDWETWGSPVWHERQPAGIASTSFDTRGKEPRRSEYVRDILLKVYPDAEVWGKWDKKSLADVPDGTVQLNDPSQFRSILERFRVTLALPALGGSWTVAKPYQCFAANTVCFMYGRLDDRGWILPSRRRMPGTKPVGEVDGVRFYSVRQDWTEGELRLARWLRIEDVAEFEQLSRHVVENNATWMHLVNAQRALLKRRWDESFLENEIERKLGLR